MRAIILISRRFSYHMFALYIYRIRIAILVTINQIPLSISNETSKILIPKYQVKKIKSK